MDECPLRVRIDRPPLLLLPDVGWSILLRTPGVLTAQRLSGLRCDVHTDIPTATLTFAPGAVFVIATGAPWMSWLNVDPVQALKVLRLDRRARQCVDDLGPTALHALG